MVEPAVDWTERSRFGTLSSETNVVIEKASQYFRAVPTADGCRGGPSRPSAYEPPPLAEPTTKMMAPLLRAGGGRALPPFAIRASSSRLRRATASRGEDPNRQEPEYPDAVAGAAERMREEVRRYVSGRGGPPIKLVGVLATRAPPPDPGGHSHPADDGDDTHGNELYACSIAASCLHDGISYETWRVEPTPAGVEAAIDEANGREDVHGLLIFHPLRIDLGGGGTYRCERTGVRHRTTEDYFRDLVRPEKDVEGHRRRGMRGGALRAGPAAGGGEADAPPDDGWTSDVGPIYPCTALAVLRIVELFRPAGGGGDGWSGETMTVVNRSEVLGLPLAAMLSGRGARVLSVDAESILEFGPRGRVRRTDLTLEGCVRESAVVVSGVPDPDFCIPTDWIREGTTVINVASGHGGNFDEGTVGKVPGVTYVPHVGRVTVAALQYNLICLHKNYHS